MAAAGYCRCRSLTYGILEGYRIIIDGKTFNRELTQFCRILSSHERFCSTLSSSSSSPIGSTTSYSTDGESKAKQAEARTIHGEVSVLYQRGLPVVTVPLPSRRERCRFTLRPVTHTVGDFLRHVQNEDKGIDRIGVKTVDGVRVAASTSIEALMQDDFHLVVNDVVYHVTPPPSERLTHEQLERLSNVRHVVSVLYEALNVDEHQLRKERELLQKLEDIKFELEPLENKKKTLEEFSSRRTTFFTWLGLGLMATQFGILARLTWWEYSWDIMEPVTYFVTYGTSMAAYAYFVLTKQDYILPDVKDRQFLITFYKQANKIGLDVERYNELKNSIAVIERDIGRLRDPLYLHLPSHVLVSEKRSSDVDEASDALQALQHKSNSKSETDKSSAL